MAQPPALPWRVVWITGASSGIGADIARQLASAGVTVAASARHAGSLRELARERPTIRPYVLDVTDASLVEDALVEIERDLGPVDLVIAAAGTYAPVSLDGLSPAPFRTMYETNFLGVVHVLSAVLPVMRARRKGHVAWFASVAGYRGLPKAAGYGPTKAALINLAESLKPDLEADGIAVSVINPGFVRTPLTAQNDFPMPFLMEPDDAARRTITGLAARRFEIAYPTGFVALLKFARLLPYRLYFVLIRRAVLKR